MSRARSRFGNSANPLIVIEWVIAACTFISGVYLASPILNVNVLVNMNSPIAVALASTVGVLAIAAVGLVGSLLLIAGIVKRKAKWRAAALFIIGLVRFYVLFATLLINGIFPLTWISSLAVVVICFYIWGRIKKRGAE